MIKTGDKLPDFSLPDQDGQQITPADWKGRKIVLFAFPRADTPG